MNRFSALVFVVLVNAVLTFGQAVTSNTEPPISLAPSTAIEPKAAPPNEDSAIDPASLIPDLPALPSAKATLVGGTVRKVDRVQDRVTIQLFGGGKTTVFFDGRTNVYRDGGPSSLASLKPGERIYLDTILYKDMVFARNIRLRTGTASGDSQGIVVAYRPERNELLVRDVTAPQPLKLRVGPDTRVTQDGQPASLSRLKDGALVAIKFGSENTGRDFAREISIVAEPGQLFTFAGKITFLDLHGGLLVLTSSTNGKTYEIYLEPSLSVDKKLREGDDVTALTRFDENRYVAHSLTVNQPAQ